MINLRLKSWKFKADNKAQFELTTDLNRAMRIPSKRTRVGRANQA